MWCQITGLTGFYFSKWMRLTYVVSCGDRSMACWGNRLPFLGGKFECVYEAFWYSRSVRTYFSGFGVGLEKTTTNHSTPTLTAVETGFSDWAQKGMDCWRVLMWSTSAPGARAVAAESRDPDGDRVQGRVRLSVWDYLNTRIQGHSDLGRPHQKYGAS